ncbi:MAG: radical SAM protein [Hyphomicrobiales bacterium]|nr:radical SAM protein [Hyphomicrobiales bacterium]
MKALLNTALNYTESWLRRPEPASLPVILDIVLTKACNLRCTFCISYTSSETSYWLDYGLYERIAAELFPTAWDVQFCSGGEPFLYPRLRDALRLAAKHGCKTTVTTNGMLTDAKTADWIIEDQSLHKIWLSFDGGTKPTLERLRRGANFDKIIGNMRALIDKRRARGRKWPKVAMRFVMMRSNVEELPGLIALAAETGVSFVEGRYLNVANEIDMDESLFRHPELAERVFGAAREAARKHGIGLSLPPLPGRDRDGHRCIKPWEMCQIDIDGSIRFCYKSWRQRLGRFDDGFKAIWSGPHYRRLRATMDTDEPYFPYCRHCVMRRGIDHEFAHDQRIHADDYVIPGLEDLQTAFNERVDENKKAFADRKERKRAEAKNEAGSV